MHPSISTSYLIPAICLNPILFLHSVNAILSHVLPPIIIDAAVQPPPYYPKGPSAEYPHLDMHASDSLCWSYTVFMVCAQLLVFGRVSMHRTERKERARKKKERGSTIRTLAVDKNEDGMSRNGNGHTICPISISNGAPKGDAMPATVVDDSTGVDLNRWHYDGSNDDSEGDDDVETTDSEVIM